MSKLSFYRVRAVMTAPNTFELDGPTSSPPTEREFTLILRSAPFVITHTAKGSAPDGLCGGTGVSGRAAADKATPKPC